MFWAVSRSCKVVHGRMAPVGGHNHGWWCTGKRSCGRWNFPGNSRCYACGKIPGHVPVGAGAGPKEPQGEWRLWPGRRPRDRRGAQPRPPHGDAAPAARQPTEIEALQESINGIKRSGLEDDELLSSLETKLADLKLAKRNSKPTWQQARDSGSLLVRRKKALEKANLDKAQVELEIEAAKAKLLDADTKIKSIEEEVAKLEKEAAIAPAIPPMLAEALGLGNIPEEVLKDEKGKQYVDAIGEAIKALASLVAPQASPERSADAAAAAATSPPGQPTGDDVEMEDGDGEKTNEQREQEAADLLQQSVGEGHEVPREVLKRMATEVAKSYKRRKSQAGGQEPSQAQASG